MPPHLTADDILYNQAGVVAVNKPSGLPTQPLRGNPEFCVEHQARELLDNPGIWAANRLDRGTSGLLLLSATPDAARLLQSQLAARTVHKTYLALVSPPPRQPRWRIHGYLEKTPHPTHAFFRFLPKPTPGAKKSITDFELLEVLGERALVCAQPITGRSHQIRIHLAAGKNPILGDDLYGPAPPAAPRLMLHAEAIRFQAANGSDPIEINAPPGPDWHDAASTA